MSAHASPAIRRRRAMAIVAVLVAALALSLAASSLSGPGVLHEAAAAYGRKGGDALPEGFEDEAFRLRAKEEVRVDEKSGLVGFSCDGGVDVVFESVEKELLARGWTGVDSESKGWGSFVKSEGRYRWMFVTCVDVGGSTSVVVRFMAKEEA